MQDPSTKKEEAVTAAENNMDELAPGKPAAQTEDETEENTEDLFHDMDGGEG